MGVAMRKLSVEQRAEIERRIRTGERQVAIARDFNVTKRCICKIAKQIGQSYNAVHSVKAKLYLKGQELAAALSAGERQTYLAERFDVSRATMNRYAKAIGQSYYFNHTKKARAYQSEAQA